MIPVLMQRHFIGKSFFACYRIMCVTNWSDRENLVVFIYLQQMFWGEFYLQSANKNSDCFFEIKFISHILQDKMMMPVIKITDKKKQFHHKKMMIHSWIWPSKTICFVKINSKKKLSTSIQRNPISSLRCRSSSAKKIFALLTSSSLYDYKSILQEFENLIKLKFEKIHP